MVIVILAEGAIKPEEIKSVIELEKFNKSIVQYTETDMKCLQDYFIDLEKEKKYFDTIQIVIRVICSISMILAVCLFLHTFALICNCMKFYSLSFIVLFMLLYAI